MSAVTRIEKVPNKTEAVTEALGAAIVGGHLVPNLVLVPDELQVKYGVSRTVVREAIQVLKAKGLVVAFPQRGTTVSPRESWNLLDPDVVRWAPDGCWLRRDTAELYDELRTLAAAKPYNAVLAYVARAYVHPDGPQE